MRIGILGGTGNMGKGLAIRWALKHDVLVGSRSFEKARETAKGAGENCQRILSSGNAGQHQRCTQQRRCRGSRCFGGDSSRISHSRDFVRARRTHAVSKAVVSTVVSMKRSDGLFSYTPLSSDKLGREHEESAGEVIQEIVELAPVVSAFQTVPAGYLNNIDSVLNIDVLIASDHARAIPVVSRLICDIPNLRPIRVGPLVNSKLIESLTPLLLNAAILNKLREPAIRIVPWMPKSFEE